MAEHDAKRWVHFGSHCLKQSRAMFVVNLLRVRMSEIHGKHRLSLPKCGSLRPLAGLGQTPISFLLCDRRERLQHFGNPQLPPLFLPRDLLTQKTT